MKIIILSFSYGIYAQAPIDYAGVDYSLINWESRPPTEWLNHKIWIKETQIGKTDPGWRIRKRDASLRERVGRVLDCVGECRVYRGEQYVKGKFRSSILEGDEIHTIGESYVWVFLVDGTLVRIAPYSSVSFREMNITKDYFFHHVRLNSGNMVWHSREKEPVPMSPLKETDAIFLPLSFYDARPLYYDSEPDEKDLFAFIDSDVVNKKVYERLNKLKAENNNYLDKNSKVFVVLPNGNIMGERIRAEFVTILGGESYLKNRRNLVDKTPMNFYFRGFKKRDSKIVEPSQWYRVGRKGRNFEVYFDDRLLNIGEYLTKRIPSIQTAREMLLERYSKDIYLNSKDNKSLALKGYRLWKDEEIQKRVNFLQEYTRRIETTNLLNSQKLREKLIKEGEKLKTITYNTDYFDKALRVFMTRKTFAKNSKLKKSKLNSTKNPFWNRIHYEK